MDFTLLCAKTIINLVNVVISTEHKALARITITANIIFVIPIVIIGVLTISPLYPIQEISGALLCGVVGGRDYGSCPFPSPNAPPVQSSEQSSGSVGSPFGGAASGGAASGGAASGGAFGPQANNPALSSNCQSVVVPTIIQIVRGASNPNNIFFYCPQVLTVPMNTLVTWINNDFTVHTVTFPKLYDSGLIIPNQIVRHVFSTPGTFSYGCKIHPYMTGEIIVYIPVQK
jgi:plastocyanin